MLILSVLNCLFFFFCSLQSQVPKELLYQHLEPGKVKADGNCLFHAVVMAITLGDCVYNRDNLANLLHMYTAVNSSPKMEGFQERV
jgi:hypothetical protein